MEEEGAVHQRIVLIPFADRVLIGEPGVQALIVMKGAAAEVPEAGEDGADEKGEVRALLDGDRPGHLAETRERVTRGAGAAGAKGASAMSGATTVVSLPRSDARLPCHTKKPPGHTLCRTRPRSVCRI